ncbi:MAG: PIN domain-containing protein [Actinobacteria bacterium]|nr:PIN domain-containing protein [Actinomycetota bacterium]
MRAVLDTSVFVAREQRGLVPDRQLRGCVSSVTLCELALGVDMATDPDVRAVRSHTLITVEDTLEVLDVTRAVARRFGTMMGAQRRRGRRPSMQDTLIAATALEHELPVVTQDVGFFAFDGLDVILV